MKKTILIILAVFTTIVATVAIVYFVRKPAKIANTPTPKPAASTTAMSSPETAPIMVVEPPSVCSKNIVVACASATPTPSASATTTPSTPPSVTPTPSTPSAAALDCVAKRAYEDDSRNRASFYYMEKEIANASTITSGQTILYNIIAKNTGGSSVPEATITDKLSSNLTYVDGDSGCSYDAATRVVTCTIGTLAAGSEAQRSFRATVNVAGTTAIANTAEVSSTNGQRDSCSITMDATGKVVIQPSPVPTTLPQAGVFEVTLGTIGAGLLLLIAGTVGLLLL